MKKMAKAKRMVLRLVACMLAALLLVGCGSTNGNGSSDDSGAGVQADSGGGTAATQSADANTQSETEDIQAAENNDLSGEITVFGWKGEEYYYDPIIAGYNERRENVEATTVYLDWVDGGLQSALATMAAAKNLPDVCYANDALPYFIAQGWLMPLNDYFDNDPEKQYIPRSLTDNLTFNGRMYAVPYKVTFNAILVNLDLLETLNEDPPPYDWTVDEFVRLAKKATTDKLSGINGLWDADATFMAMFDETHTLGDAGFNMETMQFNLTSGAFVKAQNLIRELVSVPGLVSDNLIDWEKRDAGDTDDDYDKKFGVNADAVRDGKVLFSWVNTSSIWWINSMGWNYDFYPLPIDPSVGYREPIEAPYTFICATTQNPDAAYDFLRFMNFSEEGMIFRTDLYANEVDDQGNPTNSFEVPPTLNPNVLAYFNSMDYIPGGVKYMLGRLDDGYRHDFWNFVPEYWKVYSENFQPKAEEIQKGTLEAAAVAQELQDKMNAEIKQYVDEFNLRLAEVEQEYDGMKQR